MTVENIEKKEMSDQEKAHAFDFIIKNSINDKLSDSEFRQVILNTWTSVDGNKK